MSQRRLISTLRRVSSSDLARYHDGWAEVTQIARRMDLQAWRFRSENDESRFIEFLEYGSGEHPSRRPEMAAALERLQGISRGEVEDWRDASSPDPGDGTG